MACIRSHPKSLGIRLAFEETEHHLGRHKTVIAAMNEQHGVMALLHLLKCRSLAETPSEAELAQET